MIRLGLQRVILMPLLRSGTVTGTNVSKLAEDLKPMVEVVAEEVC